MAVRAWGGCLCSVVLLLYATAAPSGAASIASLPAGGTVLRQPSSVAYDAGGDLFIADRGANRILVARPNQPPALFAGSDSGQPGDADGPGTRARFNAPSGLAIGTHGEIYVADAGNYAIRVITPAGVVSTFAGTASAGSVDGPKAQARFAGPTALATDAKGDLFIADGPAGIREIDAAGMVSTLPVEVHDPIGIAVGESFTLFASDPDGIVAFRLGGTTTRRYPIVPRPGAMNEGLQGLRPIGTPIGLAAIDSQSVLYTTRDGSVRYIDVDQRFTRTVAAGPLLAAPVALAVAPSGSVAVASSSGAVALVAGVDLRRPIEPSDTELLPNHFQFDPAVYNIAYVGTSFVWWDTEWDDSIAGVLEKMLRSDPDARKLDPRVVPVVMPGGTLQACEQFSKYLGESAMVRLIVVDVSRTLVTQSFSVSVETIGSDRGAWEPMLVSGLVKLQAVLAGDRVALLVVVHPEEPDMMGQAEGIPFLAADLRARGVDAISLYPDFGRARASAHLFSSIDPHFSAAGRRVAAEAVARYIERTQPWNVGNSQPAAPHPQPSSPSSLPPVTRATSRVLATARTGARPPPPAAVPSSPHFEAAWTELNSAVWMLTHTGVVRATDPNYKLAMRSLYASIGALDDGIISSARKPKTPAAPENYVERLHAALDSLSAADRDLAPRSTNRNAERLRVRALGRAREAAAAVRNLIADCGC
jgi:hypothetical protein